MRIATQDFACSTFVITFVLHKQVTWLGLGSEWGMGHSKVTWRRVWIQGGVANCFALYHNLKMHLYLKKISDNV